MDKIQSNTGYNLLSSQNGEIKQNTFKQVPYPAQSVPQKTLRDEFVSQHKKNGLFERLYNGIKNLTHLGTGSKKAQAAIDKAEKGEISEEQARATITKYRNSQANSAQILGDAASIGASMGTFFGVRTLLKKLSARNAVNNNSVLKDIFGESGNLANKMADGLKSNKKLAIISAITAAFMGGFVKDTLLRINGIGSKEFKTDKKDFNNLATEYDRSAYKFEKKHNKRMRRNSHFRNFVSGAINGLMMPVTMVGGAIVGVPLYLAGNSLNRYFIGNNNESNKSFNSYFENLSNDGVAHAALAVGMAVPLVKKGKWSNVFDKNLEKAVAKLKDAALKPAFEENRTAYNELNDLLMNSREVENIIWSSESIEKQIKKLTDENIFAVKFKQISNDGSALCKALKEDCPPSRTFEEAKKNKRW
ncbi:MAG: hypothetical protein MJ231_06295 [bacterium]|nr:hypothetical protein [bacterium]